MEELNILNSYERIYLKNVKFMFKIFKSLAPEYIMKCFTRTFEQYYSVSQIINNHKVCAANASYRTV